MTDAVKTRPAQRPATIGTLIDKMWKAREEKRELEAKVKEAEEAIRDLEDQLMERMEAEGTDKAAGTKASVSISASVVADVQDWDAFWPYVAKNKYWHLIQKRVSDPAYRELLDMGKKVPGVQPFTKRKLNLRSI